MGFQGLLAPRPGGGVASQAMRSVNAWLSEYGESHQNPTNKLLHWICVPPIMLSALGFMRCIPVPQAWSAQADWLNWASLFALAALLYYVVLSRTLALGLTVVFVLLLLLVQALSTLPWPLWLTSLAIFVAAWIGQFIGHAIEGKRPSFFKDLQFLLIGPLWLLAAAYRRFSVPY
jgi:uncharacterized membrane protein YGL010W